MAANTDLRIPDTRAPEMRVPEVRVPTRLSDAVFRGKATLLQMRRSASDLLSGVRRFPQEACGAYAFVSATSATQLWTDANPGEAWYQRGKIQNLRVAAGRLHGCVIAGGQVFSFWRQVGRASADKGYVPGRMLQEGCMIPAIGGGLCQLSNAIYQVALDSGCEIVERHRHSRIVPGSATASGRDATVAWNYIDLRFRPTVAMQLRVVLTDLELQVSLHTQQELHRASAANGSIVETGALPIYEDHACERCGETACFRHSSAPVQTGRAANRRAGLVQLHPPSSAAKGTEAQGAEAE